MNKVYLIFITMFCLIISGCTNERMPPSPEIFPPSQNVKAAIVRIRASSVVGTGFIIALDTNTNSAYIVTAAHIVKNSKDINIHFYPAQTDPKIAELIKIQPEGYTNTGIALLKVRNIERHLINKLLTLKLVNIRLTEKDKFITYSSAGGEGWGYGTAQFARQVGSLIELSASSAIEKQGSSGAPLIKENTAEVCCVIQSVSNGTFASFASDAINFIKGSPDGENILAWMNRGEELKPVQPPRPQPPRPQPPRPQPPRPQPPRPQPQPCKGTPFAPACINETCNNYKRRDRLGVNPLSQKERLSFNEHCVSLRY